MPSRTRLFVRDDGETELEVDYTFHGGSAPSGLSGPPENYDPGCSWEVEISDAWLWEHRNRRDAPSVELTSAEADRFADEVNQDPETWEPEGPDYDF